MKQVVRWSSGSIVVREGLVEDEIVAQKIERVVKESRAEEKEGFWALFGRLCSQCESSEGLTWKPEQVRGMKEADIRMAYDAFLTMPRPIWEKWTESLSVVEEIKDIVLGPVPLPGDADPNASGAVERSKKT
jgi:hypothetical protein